MAVKCSWKHCESAAFSRSLTPLEIASRAAGIFIASGRQRSITCGRRLRNNRQFAARGFARPAFTINWRFLGFVKEPGLKELLDVALEAAYLGGRRTLAYFNTNIAVETKADNTPVTKADRESEQIIRERIARSFPTHAVIGEEGGETAGDAAFRWIIDPIDGTKTFIHGVPLYGVLIGVEVKGKPSVGVIYMPAMDEMVYAASGLGCFWNGRPARVSEISKLEDATL